MRYDGTRATLRGKFAHSEDVIEIHDHLSGELETISPRAGASGHGGGDEGVMNAFVAAVNGTAEAQNTAREALESHLMAFAAEEARVEGKLIDLSAYRQNVNE